MRTITFRFALVMIFVMPWENLAYLEGIGNVLTKLIGVLVTVLWLVMVASTNRIRKPHLFHLVAFLFVLWNGAGVFWSVDVEITVDRCLTQIQILAMVYILWDLLTTPETLKTALQAYVLGAYVAIGSILSNYLSGMEETSSRFSASGFNSNTAGYHLALGLPLAWYLALFKDQGKRTYWLRLVNYAYIPAAFYGILLTASRAAFFSLFPVLLFMLATRPRLKLYQRLLLFTAIIVSLIALVPLVPQSSLQRMAGTGTEVTEGDLNNRLAIWHESVRVIQNHPFLGVGAGGFRTAAVETGKVPHNFILALLAETGMIGFSLFAAMLAIVIHAATRLPKPMWGLWVSILMVWILVNATHNFERSKQSWLFLSLVITSASLYARRAESRVSTLSALDTITFVDKERHWN